MMFAFLSFWIDDDDFDDGDLHLWWRWGMYDNGH